MKFGSFWYGYTILGLVVLAGCSGPGGATRPEQPSEQPEPQYFLAEFEEFDTSPYSDEPPAQILDVEHEVPASLMENRLDDESQASGPRTVEGFRIQVYSSQNRSEADAMFEEIMSWWINAYRSGELDEIYPYKAAEPPVYLVFRQPYYRIRVGNFATRAEANQFQEYIERRFPGAFLLPDTVSID